MHADSCVPPSQSSKTKTTGHEVDQLRQFAASEESYGTAQAASDAGALRWQAEISNEDEDADLVGDGGIDPSELGWGRQEKAQLAGWAQPFQFTNRKGADRIFARPAALP